MNPGPKSHRSNRLPLARAALVAAVTLSCGHDSGPSAANAYTVQVVSAVASPTSVHCDNLNGRPSFLFLINVHMVNTTSSPVTLVKVSSTAQYVQPPALQGTTLLISQSLPFTALYLRANDGSNFTAVSVAGTCPATSGYGSFYLTLFMQTDTGAYATAPILLAFGP